MLLTSVTPEKMGDVFCRIQKTAEYRREADKSERLCYRSERQPIFLPTSVKIRSV